MKITAQMVKELREITGAGMLDCKKALEANEGNIEASIDWLREKGIAKAAKKADRVAAEGLTKIIVDGNSAIIVEINSETDFVAKNETFIELIDTVAQHLLKEKPANVEEALKTTIDGKSLEEFLAEATSTIGEKIDLRRFEIIEKTADDVFGAYSHMGGKIGVIVELKATADEAGAKDVAMHAAAMNPQFVTRDEVSKEFIEKERQIQMELTKNDPKTADKPEKVLVGIVEGKLNKQLKEIVLVDQVFVKNSDQTVGDFIKGMKATIGKVVRFGVGEGIEKNEVDFADEVMSQVNAK
ncbi:translation elongation factor Ts [Erysipelotrichaceae bacterium OttesenSCG-928-M19]|nr:translation elongation factor Ts [Erysipelotrichaceae bacterium OttesenSCG-928-M19]